MIVVDEVFAVFAVPWLPWLMAVGILVLGLVLWQRFSARLQRLRRALRRAIELIEHGEGAASFRQRFPAIFEGLAQDAVLGGPWRAYAQTLTAVPGNEQALGAPRSPAAVFDDRLFGAVGLNLRFYQAVPNILVGLGLLFTFMGLVAALHFASAGVTATDVREAQAALRELLAAATFKFVTSIAGLAASIVFSWREKAQLHAAQAEIRWLCQALEERLVPLTPEGLMVAQIEETRRINQRLGQLGRSLIVRAPESIEARLADELTLATRPLKAALERVARRFETLDERVAGDLVAASQTVRELAGRASALAEAAAAAPAAGDRAAAPATAAAAGDERPPAAQAAPPAARRDAGAAERRGRAAAGGTAPLSAGPVGSPLRLLQHRLAELSVAVQTGLDRLRGRPPIDRDGIEAVLLTTHDRVREARHALNTVAATLLAAADSPDEEARIRELLGEIDAGLKQSRSALQEAVEGLSPSRQEP
jgi:hypothetical protein